uniref:Uncharacterized protein n=1 Tax=Salix viminalis TaxID=40686 RepID=A0A6N2LBQ1_SALVM
MISDQASFPPTMFDQRSRNGLRFSMQSKRDVLLHHVFDLIWSIEPGDQEEERKHPVLVSNLGFLCLVLFHMIFRGIAITSHWYQVWVRYINSCGST